jgi:hypothetical protein
MHKWLIRTNLRVGQQDMYEEVTAERALNEACLHLRRVGAGQGKVHG